MQYLITIPETQQALALIDYIKASGIVTQIKPIIEEYDTPNEETIEAINEVRNGKVNVYSSSKEMFDKLKKKANV